MTIQIRSLEPKDALDFAEFFDNMDFHHAEHWRGCYCQYYHLKGTGEQWMKTRGEKAREMALINVARGYTRGYLALDGGRILFVLPEILLRRRVPAQYENMVHLIGFAVLIILMIYITTQDIINPIVIP